MERLIVRPDVPARILIHVAEVVRVIDKHINSFRRPLQGVVMKTLIQIIDQPKTGSWPYAEVGTSKTLTTGDLVVALGHAGGFDPVRTPPVRFGRIITHQSNKFLSTDCTLIGGDSGGPLFDLNGKVIGIHSSIGTDLSSNNHASIEGFHQDWKKLQAG